MKKIILNSGRMILLLVLVYSFSGECTRVKITTDDFRKATSVCEIYQFPDSCRVISFDLTFTVTDRVKTFSSQSNKFTPEMIKFKEVNSMKTRKYYIENIKLRGKDGKVVKANSLCIDFE